MENRLPSFEMIAKAEKWLDGEPVVYKLGYDTMNICNNLHPGSAVLDYYADRQINNDTAYVPKANEFYKDIALRLSGVSRKKLIETFDKIKVTFKNKSGEENFECEL